MGTRRGGGASELMSPEQIVWNKTGIRCTIEFLRFPMKISFGKIAYAIVVLAGLLYAFIELRGPNGFQGFLDRRKEVQQFEAGNEQLRRELAQKQERIRRLESDPAEQEIEIRERLKLAGPDEKVYILDEKKK
jgi:cell division protein FtsB